MARRVTRGTMVVAGRVFDVLELRAGEFVVLDERVVIRSIRAAPHKPRPG